jgi:hypothetical protein
MSFSPEISINKKDNFFKAKRSDEQKIPEMKRYLGEKEKTTEQIIIIEHINKQLNNRLKKYDLPEKNVSPKHAHILREEFYNKKIEEFEKKEELKSEKTLAEKLYAKNFEDKTLAKFVPETQEIFIKESDSLSVFYHRFFHETAEFKSYQETEIIEDGTKVRQLGISFITKSGEKRFENLKEATIEELNKREFYETAFGNPDLPKQLQQEMEWTQERRINLLSKKGDESERERLRDTLYFPYPFKKEEREMFESREGRKVLNNLVKKIYAKNNDFKNSDEVMELFFQSIFTGKFEWKELTEKTFGKGTFEELGKKDQNPQELWKFVNRLGNEKRSNDKKETIIFWNPQFLGKTI